jgi:NitT/TauT family transport system substrate-binding protein
MAQALKSGSGILQAFAVLCFVLRACAATAASLEPLSVRLDWLPGAYHAPLYLAKERGYYSALGLDVTINSGQGSAVTLQVVGSGAETIGVAGMPALVTAVSKNLPVIAIAVMVQNSQASVISLKSSSIRTPQDLVGKRWGAVPGEESAQLFTAFSALNHIDLQSVHKISLSAAASRTALMNGDVDFICGWASADALKLARVKPLNDPMLFRDRGLNMLGSTLFVARSTLATKSDVLRRFMLATRKAADEIAANPQAGVDALLHARSELDQALLASESKIFTAATHTSRSAGHPYGWVAPPDLIDTLDVMRKFYAVPAGVTPDSVYTDQFVR